MKGEKILHIVTVSFVINHFFGKQFSYLKKCTGNEYHLGCSPSLEFLELSQQLEYIPLEVEIIRSISPLKDLKAIFKIYKYIRRNNINKVIGHTPKGGMVAMIASFLADVDDRIYFRHGIIYETSSGFRRILLKNIDRLTGYFSTTVVCVSESVKSISEKDNLSSPNKNIILGLGTCNGVDTQLKFNPNLINTYNIDLLQSRLNIHKKEKVVGYVGRLVKDKGIDDLIKAWDIVKLDFVNAKLLLVGPIEERDSISNYSKDRIANEQSIIFIDFVPDASQYFSLMNVFVLPTYREGFPTVALEASSMKLPVIITKATGCEEAIIENKTGLFCTHSPNDIASKIMFYLDNEKTEREHGCNGRVFVDENFEQTKIWDIINNKLDI